MVDLASDGRTILISSHQIAEVERIASHVAFVARGRLLLAAPMDELRWTALLDATEGFSGADVAETVRRALEVKVRSGATGGRIGPDELLAAVAGIGRAF